MKKFLRLFMALLIVAVVATMGIATPYGYTLWEDEYVESGDSATTSEIIDLKRSPAVYLDHGVMTLWIKAVASGDLTRAYQVDYRLWGGDNSEWTDYYTLCANLSTTTDLMGDSCSSDYPHPLDISVPNCGKIQFKITPASGSGATINADLAGN